jgi:glycosyltransferase involved in cell wall biosynthesis
MQESIEPGALEVIVVDDGSATDIRGVVESIGGGRVELRYERQDPSGLDAARNTGASVAAGGVLAYLDDDVLLGPTWAAAVSDAFATQGCDAMAGRILLQLEAPQPQWLNARLRLYLTELDLGPEPRWLDTGPLPFGANCAVTRTAFDRGTGFAAGLDRAGESLLSNGDIEFFRRLRARGERILYWPGASVRHRIPADRLTPAWFGRRAYAQGVSDAILDDVRDGGRTGRNRARQLVRFGRTLPILARNLVSGRGTVPASVWLAYCRGRLDGMAGRTRA